MGGRYRRLSGRGAIDFTAMLSSAQVKAHLMAQDAAFFPKVLIINTYFFGIIILIFSSVLYL
jgi:hypothetical protein